MAGPLAQFFRRYSNFDYNSSNSAPSEFRRLCSFKKWDKRQKDTAHDAFKSALTKQFNLNYGTSVSDVGSWQSLCTYIGVEPIPETVEECKKIVQRTHVNLVDLVDVFGTNRRVRVFETVKELSEYSKTSRKIFPREDVHAGDLLKYMLRQIWAPPPEGSKAKTRRRNGKKTSD